MQYKALVSRGIPVADESIHVIIKDTDSFETFKQQIIEALSITDYRAAIQQHRLFEDTSLVNNLNNEEYSACARAVDLVYPLPRLSDKHNLAGIQFQFDKIMANGEVLQLYLHEVESYNDLIEAICNIWDILDKRLAVTNNRKQDFDLFYNSLPMDTKLKVQMVMQLLYGMSSKQQVEASLRQEHVAQQDSL